MNNGPTLSLPQQMGTGERQHHSVVVSAIGAAVIGVADTRVPCVPLRKTERGGVAEKER